MLAARAFLGVIAEDGFWAHLLGLRDRLYAGLRTAFDAAGLPIRVQSVGARCGMYVGLDPAVDVTTYEQAARMDRRMMNAFCRDMHARGSS